MRFALFHGSATPNTADAHVPSAALPDADLIVPIIEGLFKQPIGIPHTHASIARSYVSTMSKSHLVRNPDQKFHFRNSGSEIGDAQWNFWCRRRAALLQAIHDAAFVATLPIIFGNMFAGPESASLSG
jgi:hypothetical protein